MDVLDKGIQLMGLMATMPNAGPPMAAVRKRAQDAIAGADMSPEDWRELAGNMLKFFAEEAAEPEHAEDEETEESLDGSIATDSALRLALDSESVRTFDSDGRMRVAKANISKANICPYRGDEIPGWEELGLEPDKIYQLLRDPEELRKAAATFNGVPLLRKHVPVDAGDHKKNDIVGTTGTDANFEDPYLTNSLVIWSQEGVDYIESEKQRELSCGYHYTPDMTAGIFGGKPFDGVMRNIEGNHVALVEEGRAGPDVVVGDSALNVRDRGPTVQKPRAKREPAARDSSQEIAMPTRLEFLALTRTARAVNPMLAFDAKVEYAPIFKGLTTKNLKQRKPVIMDELKKALKGKTIAKDANVEHLAHMLDQFEHVTEPKSLDESVSEPQHKAMEAAAHGSSTLGIPKDVGQEFAKADKGKSFDMIRDWAMGKGMSEDDIEDLRKMHEGKDEMPENALDEDEEAEDESEEETEEEAEDESEEEAEKAKKVKDAKAAKDKKAKDSKKGGAMDRKNVVTVDEMNKAITSAVTQANRNAREAQEAREFVRPYVGELSMALDSAEKIYRSAAVVLKIEDADTVHPSALKTIIKTCARPASAQQNGFEPAALAYDAAGDGSSDSFTKMFPGAARIGTA